MRRSFVALALLFTLSIAPLAAQAPDAAGLWETEGGESWIRVERQRDGTLAGRIVWLAEPIDSVSGRPKYDAKHPDSAVRGRPILGLPLMGQFRPDDKPGHWKDGRIYDARSGKTYNATLALAGRDTLKLRGYVKLGFVKAGRTTRWLRVPEGQTPDSGSALLR